MSDALSAVLSDVLPRNATAYAIGFDAAERENLMRLAGAAHLTFLDDAEALGDALDVVLAGPAWEAAFTGFDSTTFTDRLARLDVALRPGGTLVVSVANVHSSAELLTPAPAGRGVFDADGVSYDTSRPASASALRVALEQLGHAVVNVHEIYGGEERWCVLGPEAATMTREIDVLRRFVSRAIEADLRLEPVVPVEQFVERLAAADALSTAATSFVAVCGGRGRALYAEDGAGHVQWLDGSIHDASWAVGGGSDAIDARERPFNVPVARSLEAQLLRDIAAADTADFRLTAQRIGTWVMESSSLNGRRDIDWRDIAWDGERVAALWTTGIDESGQEGIERDVLLARGWRRFAARVRVLEPTMPWPATLSDDELLRLWLSMSGVPDERAPELIELTSEDSPAPATDAWTQRYALEEASDRIVALEHEVAALHETLRRRDGELAVRAKAIRSLRGQVLSASRNRDLMVKANADIKSSASFKLAAQFRKAALVTRPKTLVREVGKAADKRVRSLRRLR